MFSFLNRNKPSAADIKSKISGSGNAGDSIEKDLQKEIEEIQKNLYLAITSKRTDIVVSVLNEWFKEKSQSKDEIKYFFNKNYCENYTTSPLLVAYTLKDRDILRALLNFGADPSLIDKKHNKCLTELVNEESEINGPMQQLINDSFMQAIVQKNFSILEQFLTSGFQLIGANKCLPDDNTYLHWAVMYSTEPIVRLLLEKGSDVNAVNKFGATALHECIAKRKIKNEETLVESLEIIETLLSFKADPFGAKGTGGQFKDLTPMDMACHLYHVKKEPEIYNLIKEFNSDGLSTTSSSINSPLFKSYSVPSPDTSINQSPQMPKISRTVSASIIQALDAISQNQNNVSTNNETIVSENAPATPPKTITEIEKCLSWTHEKDFSDERSRLNSCLWPRPQTCIVFDENLENRFLLNDIKIKPMNIYIKPPFTYAYMDFINRIANSFGGMDFNCIHKPPDTSDTAYITVTIDKTQFNRENAYSLLVTQTKIEINAIDEVALQYALFTFMQLCKIYSRTNIPSLKILDYSDIKYRSILFDFSQGFYFKYEYFLAILQMLTFYKINQVHFYVKFSSLPPADTKLQWYHMIKNWFGLMKFCEEVHLEVVPAIDISNDVAEICDVMTQIREYLDLFQGFKFVNIGPRLTSLLTCMDNKNPFNLDSNQYIMLSSYLYHAGDKEMVEELEKIDKCVFMEYGIKAGTDFGKKSRNLHKSGRPYFYCVGSSNWNSLLGSPESCLHNIYDAIQRKPLDNPCGIVMCNFHGSLFKTAFAFNLNSMMMLAGCAWNSKITIEDVKQSLPRALLDHGLISQTDGEIGVLMLELGKLETFLTCKANNLRAYDGLPCEKGSIFVQMMHTPDEIELDNFDRNQFKNVLFQLRAHQSKLKSLLTNSRNYLFKEVAIVVEIAVHMFKFLYVLYNTGTRQQHNTSSSKAGLSVVNIGIVNLNLTTRTDLANKLILLMEEYCDIFPMFYSEESTQGHMESYFNSLIDKLLVGQLDANTSEYINLIKYKQENLIEKNTVQNLSQSNYLIQHI